MTASPGAAAPRPRTIYLDQATISLLARGAMKAATTGAFEQLRESGELRPVFSLAHLHETRSHPARAARELIATFIDPPKKSCWIVDRRILAQRELAGLFFEKQGFPRPPLEPLCDSLQRALFAGKEKPLQIAVEEFTFRRTLGELEQDSPIAQEFAAWLAAENSFPNVKAMAGATTREKGAAYLLGEFREGFASYLLELLPAKLPDGRPVSEIRRKSFIESAQWNSLEKCPLIFLLKTAHEQYLRDSAAGTMPPPFAGLAHLGALPFVDLFLCDRRTREGLRRAQVPDGMVERCFSDLGDALRAGMK